MAGNDETEAHYHAKKHAHLEAMDLTPESVGYAFQFSVFALICCLLMEFGAKFFRVGQKRPSTSDSGTVMWSTKTLVEAAEPEADDPNVYLGDIHAHSSYINYMCFLKVCAAMFSSMTVVAIAICTLHARKWGYHPLLCGLFGGRQTLIWWHRVADVDEWGFFLLYLATLIYAFVFWFFTDLFQYGCRAATVLDGTMLEKMQRTVWLKWLPKSDKKRGKKFQLDEDSFQRVAVDLADAIEFRKDLVEKKEKRQERKDNERRQRFLKRRRAQERKQKMEQQVMEQRPSSAPETKRAPGGQMVQEVLRRGTMAMGMLKLKEEEKSDDYALETLDLLRSQKEAKETDLRKSGTTEFVAVIPVTDALHDACFQLRDAIERVKAFTDMTSNKQMVEWWYRRQQSLSESRVKTLKLELLKLKLSPRELTGDAFVTFKRKEDRDDFLRHEPPRWWELARICRGYSHFTFGHPPFSAVTLKVEPAPHPTDVRWGDIHVSLVGRLTRFYILTILLSIVMVMLATPTVIWGLMDAFKKSVSVKEGGGGGFGFGLVPFLAKAYDKILQKTNSMALVAINSCLLPMLIEMIADAERSKLHSFVARRQLHMNFFFLLLNLVILQMLQAWGVEEIMREYHELIDGGDIIEKLQKTGRRMSLEYAVFVQKYLVNSAFLSGGVSMLSGIRQHVTQWLYLRYFAVTPEDRKQAVLYEPFSWGFWYAWCLALICITVLMSVLCPSVLPVSAMLFALRYFIDRYNFEMKYEVLGSETGGAFAPIVVMYMRLSISFWMFIMGCFLLSVDVIDMETGSWAHWFKWKGTMFLIALGIFMGMVTIAIDRMTRWRSKMFSDVGKKVDTEMDFGPAMTKSFTTPAGGEAKMSEAVWTALNNQMEQAQIQYFLFPERILERFAGKLGLNEGLTEEVRVTDTDLDWNVTANEDYIWTFPDVELVLDKLKERNASDDKLSLDMVDQFFKEGFDFDTMDQLDDSFLDELETRLEEQDAVSGSPGTTFEIDSIQTSEVEMATFKSIRPDLKDTIPENPDYAGGMM